jgi:hypothetical protein
MNNDDVFDLDRFVTAQEPVIPQVYRELRDGRKQSHWMWFVFPQLKGLGHSAMARRDAIASSAEARAYLDHSLLGPRLIDLTEVVNQVTGLDRADFRHPGRHEVSLVDDPVRGGRPERRGFPKCVRQIFLRPNGPPHHGKLPRE